MYNSSFAASAPCETVDECRQFLQTMGEKLYQNKWQRIKHWQIVTIPKWSFAVSTEYQVVVELETLQIEGSQT